MSNPIYRSGKVIAEMIEMNKVIAVSALAMAGMFSTQALADESKTGFYVTGKAGASVMSWICPYISRHLLSLNPLQARCRRYSRGER